MRFSPALTVRDPSLPRTWLVVTPRGLLARTEGRSLTFPTDDEVAALGLTPERAHAIGQLDGREVLAIAHEGAEPALPAGLAPLSLRAFAGLMDADGFAAAGRAMHVIDWVTHNKHCGACGALTAPHASDRAMQCTACQRTYYPRIAPAIIVLVRKGSQALLARNARFPGKFYSTLAGFSEIGESLEETLVREVKEEVGVDVGRPQYFGSQPWPFPHSLMIGFVAEWLGGEIAVDPTEIADAQWFDATALPEIPPRLSIARRLIDAWVREVTAP